MNAIQKWGIWLVVTVSAVTVSYFWLDRPIALFVHRSLQGFNAFVLLTYIPNVVTPAILIGFVAVGLSGLSSRSMVTSAAPAGVSAVALNNAPTNAPARDFAIILSSPTPVHVRHSHFAAHLDRCQQIGRAHV